MRIIPNRTGTTRRRPLRILAMLRGRWDEQRAPALQALADLGHEVVYVDEILPRSGYRAVIERLKFDVAVLWGTTLQNFLMSENEPFLLDEVGLPYVSLWTDNPTKHLFLLRHVETPMHRGMFLPDTHVIAQMKSLGYDNLFYLPPWHIDPDIFRPMPADPSVSYSVSFAGTMNPYHAERERWRLFWDREMNSAADRIIDGVRRTRDYVDVFDTIAETFDPRSLHFSLISHAIHFEQKAIAREQVIEAMQGRPLCITGIGSASNLPANVTTNPGRAWNDLSPLFASSLINLNTTQWPRSCHHRLFQTTASAAFCVSDWREDAVALYEPDHEVVYYRSLGELGEIVDRFTTEPAAARKIAEAGYRRFLAHHTAAHRMAEFSSVLEKLI